MLKSAKHDGSHGAYVSGGAFELHIITESQEVLILKMLFHSHIMLNDTLRTFLANHIFFALFFQYPLPRLL